MAEVSSSPYLQQNRHHRYSSDLELDESDVFYSSPVDSPYNSPNQLNHYNISSIPQRFDSQPISCYKSSMERSGPHQSAPVNVPAWQGRVDFGQDCFDEEGSEMVPPHVMVARSHVTNAFSVLEGAGRTLKGRDLRRVRNAVWQKTGFIPL